MSAVTQTKGFAQLATACACALAAASIFFMAAVGQGSQPKKGGNTQSAAGQKASELKKYYAGTKACIGECHAKSTDGRDTNKYAVCRGDEYSRWRQDRQHQEAFKVLLTPAADAIAAAVEPGVKAADQAKCLACHAAVLHADDTKDETFSLEEGVSCTVCHGPHAEWIEKHHGSKLESRIKEWREKSREDKEDQFGMRDLWDARKRAALCASCHIGNADQGKVITHDMYAAGHPPLPAIEVGAFSDEMRHWQYLKEKSPTVKKLLRIKPEDANFEETRFVLVGGMVGLADTCRLLASDAEQAAVDNRSIDFAQFDCYACHHDLDQPGWRQQRGYAGKPGRVPLRHWPNVLVAAGLQQLGESDEKYRELLTELNEACSAKPFGDAGRVAAAAAKLADWADDQSEKLDKRPIGQADAVRLIRSLAGEARTATCDYDTAHQIVWALQTLFNELKFATTPSDQRQQRFDAEIPSLNLTLPNAREAKNPQSLAVELEKRSQFDPAKFRADITRHFERLSKPPTARP